MIAFVQRHRLISILVAVAVLGLMSVVIIGFFGPRPEEPGASPVDPPTAESTLDPTPVDVGGCDNASIVVATAADLTSALASAQAGDIISLLAGTYSGNFVATESGTPEAPITLCGTAESVLDGGTTDDGYVLHLDHAQYWHLDGFTVTNGQKGVMADGTVGTTIENLTVTLTGDEAIHLRNFSTDNIVRGNLISDTGHRREKFGEGIYIGTAESNWCDVSDCKPDNSDRNLIEGNTISLTTAESVDIKEGTSAGIVRNNSFDGSGIREADSWVDVKGNDWLIEGNTGVNSPLDGFQTHEILDGWGTRNTFRANSATLNGSGFGFSLTPVRDNVVTCTNTVSAAGEGFSNVTCSG